MNSCQISIASTSGTNRTRVVQANLDELRLLKLKLKPAVLFKGQVKLLGGSQGFIQQEDSN